MPHDVFDTPRAGPYSGTPIDALPIETISRIRMVVARASRTLMASSLKQNAFLTLEWHRGGDHPPYGRPPNGDVDCREYHPFLVGGPHMGLDW